MKSLSAFTTMLGCVVALAAIALAGCSGRNVSSNVPGVVSSPAGSQPGSGFGAGDTTLPRSLQPISTASPHSFQMFTVPNCSSCEPHGIAVGPDRLYYVTFSGNKVGSVTYAGSMGSQYATSTEPNEIAEGINGGMYIANQGDAALGELAESGFGGSIYGSWNDFKVGSAGTGGVASDPNGVLWYSEFYNDSVVRMTTYGSLLGRTSVSTGGGPDRIAVGPDNNSMYVTEFKGNKIAKFDLSGNLLSETSVTSGSGPLFIASGADGNVYFTEYYGNNCSGGGYIGKLTQSGTLTMIATPSCANVGITSGIDGNIWFTEFLLGKIAQLNVATDVITEYSLPSGYTSDGPYAIASGMDGRLWFTTQDGPYVGAFQP